jgi:hypothetical protein
MNETGNNREDRALDALIAAAFLPELKTDRLTNDELAALAAADHCVLPEDLAALKARGNPFAAGSSSKPFAESSSTPVRETAMAMNRKNEKDEQSEQTRAELERKARELLG